MLPIISEDNHQDVLNALEYYLKNKGDEFVQSKHTRITTLIAWLKIKQEIAASREDKRS